MLGLLLHQENHCAFSPIRLTDSLAPKAWERDSRQGRVGKGPLEKAEGQKAVSFSLSR